MKKEILESAKDALTGGVLDNKVQDGHFLQVIENKEVTQVEAYIDLPISEIHALDNREFLTPNVTWRDSVKGLKCEGWDDVADQVREYFTSELYEKLFPTPGAQRPLTMGFTGGAPHCLFGNHRLSAGKALLAKTSEDSKLYKVKCLYRPVKEAIKSVLEECLKNGDTLKYYHLPVDNCTGRYKFFYDEGYRNFLRVDSVNQKTKIYVFGEYFDCFKVQYTFPFLPRIFKSDMYSLCKRLSFRTIPNYLIEQILDETKFGAEFNM